MTRIFKTAFAATGDREALADTDQPDGKVSLPSGWTPDYELEDTDPNYRPVGRGEMNGALFEITESLGEIQQYGFVPWRAVPGGWPLNSRVVFTDGFVYRSTVAANTTTPGSSVTWAKENLNGIVGMTFSQVDSLTSDQGPIIVTDHGGAVYAWNGTKYAPLIASETYAGALKVATTALAQALTDDATALTPAKLAAAFGGGNQGITSPGYQKLPGGLIIQWGQSSAAGEVAVTFPVAFTTFTFGVFSTINASLPDSNTIVSTFYDRSNTPNVLTSALIGKRFQISGGGAGIAAQPIFWVAIGY